MVSLLVGLVAKGERVGEVRTRLCELAFHCSLAGVHRLGDLGRGEIEEIPKYDRLALTAREHRKCALDVDGFGAGRWDGPRIVRLLLLLGAQTPLGERRCGRD